MSKLLILSLLFILLLTPTSPVSAQTARQEALLAQLQSLLVQLASLQEQIADKNLGQNQVSGERPTQLIPSKYYDGEYVAIYLVEGNTLVSYGHTVPTESDHQLWQLFRDVAGDRVINDYFTEFRLFNDKNAKFDAFVEQLPRTEDWIFGVNIANTDLANYAARQSTTELFIHEYAHVVFHYEIDAATAFEDRFWNHRSRKASDYVSTYAMISSEEDFAESFTHFVLNPKPNGNLLRNEKVKFFYNYDELRDVREDIRDRVFD